MSKDSGSGSGTEDDDDAADPWVGMSTQSQWHIKRLIPPEQRNGLGTNIPDKEPKWTMKRFEADWVESGRKWAEISWPG